jgi:glutamine synthetase adenylyltransferase
VMRALRRAKQESALLIALADIGGVWDVVQVTEALTRFADAAVSDALRFLLRGAADGGRLLLVDRADPEPGCGVVVLAMGKHGARELNYSSDIDLVVFFDPESPAVPAQGEPARTFVAMTRTLARLLQERTGDGYVLRVDLRLRPDPGSTAVAISLPAAYSYYEMHGQNWERAALIKARAVAGDTALGRQLLADLAPFIWRKYFDYAAIADIHAMKRQIHAVRGHAEVAVAGHDVKLGRGGIREVEFFVQTQQLIFGGRTLSGLIDPVEAGRSYSALAASIVRATLAHVETAFAAEYGRVPGGRCVIIGMGKLGSREMTASSDLDLILLYDFDEGSAESDGARPLHAVQYYTRLTQRLVSALTVATRRGRLYDVDMRLRPSGGKGPVATQMRSFRAYQVDEAETWEHMALTRARVIGGDAGLQAEAEAVMREVLSRPRAAEELRREVFDMRRLIAREKGEDDAWDLKLASGGLVDIEFVAQYLALRHAHAHPAMLDVDPDAVLAEAERAGVLSPDHAAVLRDAHRLYATVMQMVRLAIDGDFKPDEVGAGVLRRIAAAAQCPDFPRLTRQLGETRRDVRRIFEALLKS